MPSEARTGRLAVLSFAAWALLLVTAFVLDRGDDIGRLPALLHRLVTTTFEQRVFGVSGLLQSAAGLSIAGLIALAWYGVGDRILRIHAFRAEAAAGSPWPLELASRCLVGAIAWSAVWFALGLTHLYRPWVAVAALVIGVGLAARAAPFSTAAPRDAMRSPGRAALALVVLAPALALLSALAPPTMRDTLIYHFALPKAYVAAGAGVSVPYNMATFYPQGAEMQIVWAMLLGGVGGVRPAESAAGAVTFAFAPLLLLFTYGWARQRGVDPGWAAIATLMLAAVPTAYEVAGSGYVDLALAAYTALAVHGLGRWWVTLDRAWALRMAVGAGGALSIKMTAAFLIMPLLLVVLVRCAMAVRGGARGGRDPARRRRALSGLGIVTLGLLIAAPWYVRTWARTGSPVFPFYLDAWPGHAPGWDIERSQLYRSLLAQYGGATGALDYLLTPLRMAVGSQPDRVELYDGVLGVAFLSGLPLLLWALLRRRLDVEIRIAALVSGLMFFLWLFSSQQLRFFLPLLPGLAVATTTAAATAAPADSEHGRVLRWLMLVVGASTIPVVLAWFAAADPARVVLGGEARPQYLSRRLDYYAYYELINRDLPPTVRIWLVDMRRDTYHLDRAYFSDFVFEDYTFGRYLREAREVADLHARIRREGITHLLVRHDVLLDYARSPIVDERQSREHNLARIELLRSLLRDRARLIRSDAKFLLAELLPPGAEAQDRAGAVHAPSDRIESRGSQRTH